jgi:rSAM/selenodomain-associated transferase 2
MNKRISIIIPTYNEEKNIGKLLAFLSNQENVEIIVVDGGSSDNTKSIVADFSGVKFFESPKKGRAHQLNLGAEKAGGEILYFVHADTIPPISFAKNIREAFDKNLHSGCFAYRFDKQTFLLRILGFFTRFNWFYTGGGDQTLFICRDLFQEKKGFNTNYVIMEDFELSTRLIKEKLFVVLPQKATVSARKYEKNSFIRVNKANARALKMFKSGVDPKEIKDFYLSSLKW